MNLLRVRRIQGQTPLICISLEHKAPLSMKLSSLKKEKRTFFSIGGRLSSTPRIANYGKIWFQSLETFEYFTNAEIFYNEKIYFPNKLPRSTNLLL